MDYEKKYNEALKWMRELYPGLHGATKEDAEHFFPELRESEDERMYEAIISLLKEFKNSGTLWLKPTVQLDNAISFLEKQKEQKPAEKQDYSGLNDLERAIHRGFLCSGVENVPVTIIKDTAAECMGFLALIEQNPAEWSEEDERIINALILELKTNPSVATTNGYKRFDYIDWLKSLRPSWKPSEEQIAILWDAISDLKHDGYKHTEELISLYEQLKKL